MLGGAGLGTEFLVRQSGSHAYRAGAVFAVLAAFLTVWANLAVGMIGDEGNPYNLLFGGVIVTGLLGMVLARFQPAGMAVAMVVTAVAQAAVGAFGLSADRLEGVLSMGLRRPLAARGRSVLVRGAGANPREVSAAGRSATHPSRCRPAAGTRAVQVSLSPARRA